jgi:hypothetical protein
VSHACPHPCPALPCPALPWAAPGLRPQALVNSPVRTCSADDKPQLDVGLQSGCTTGSAFTCSNQQPIIINDTLAYGFAAVAISGQAESDWCCSCYKLRFTSGAVAGKTLIVQVGQGHSTCATRL